MKRSGRQKAEWFREERIVTWAQRPSESGVVPERKNRDMGAATGGSRSGSGKKAASSPVERQIHGVEFLKLSQGFHTIFLRCYCMLVEIRLD